MPSELVGRDRELGLLLGCLDEATAGRSNLVLCVGEPGIGKTRLADELTRLARARGVVTAWGRASDSAGAPPYWPWREVLGALTGVDSRAADAAEQLASRQGEEPSFEERVRRFDAVSQFFATLARSRPVVLLLDDLHAADEPSQLLARHLARTAPESGLLVMINCREATGVLATLAREPNATQLQLGGLDRTAVGRQLAAIVGRDLPDTDLNAVFDATAGNPFFVAEIARQLDSAAAGSRPPVVVSSSVRDSIGFRLSQLSPDCATALWAAAIVGTEFAVDVVASMTGRSVADCLVSLDEAARAALIVPGATLAEHRFPHSLVRDAIVTGLSAAQRVALHRQAAEAIEYHHAGRLAPVVFDLAEHWTEAAVNGEHARAVSWIEQAGHEAMRQHAYEDGRRWFSTALTVGASTLGDCEKCRLLLALGSAQALSSEFAQALKTCGKVVALATRLGRPDLAGEAALVPEPTFDADIDQVIRALCEQAMAVLGSAPAALRARVFARYAVVCDHLSDLDAAHPAVEEAMALAANSGDPRALEAALTAYHIVRSGPDGLAEREVIADRMWALGTETGSAAACLTASEWRFDAASERGDLSRASRELEIIARWANQLGGPMSRWRLLRCRAMLAQARARFADAYRYGGEALASMSPTGFPPAFMLWSGLVSNMGHQSGHTREPLEALGVTDANADELDWPLPGVILTLSPAWLLADLGRLQEASLIYRRLGPATEWQETPHATLFIWALGIGTAAAIGADDDVATLRGRLAAYRGHHIVNGRYAMAYLGPAELWLGIGAAHLGLFDDAVADLEQAVKACATNGAEGFRVEAAYELASALVRRAAPGDHHRAHSLLVEAAPRMAELGMPPIRAKAEALLARIQADPSLALTRREREVAELVARGMTNREIATRLYVSERTAQNHVQHILDKLNLPNRSQIAVWVRGAEMSRSAE